MFFLLQGRESFTRLYKFEIANEMIRVVPFVHSVPKRALDGKTNGSVLILAHQNKFSKWQVGVRSLPILLQMWQGSGFDRPSCFMGRFVLERQSIFRWRKVNEKTGISLYLFPCKAPTFMRLKYQ